MILLLTHTVRDYDAWKPTFDEHESVRAGYGCQGHTVYRSADDPNQVTVVTRWATREGAEQFARDPSLAEAMKKGGVISEPTVTWLEEAETSSYAASRAA
jgi:heme-degrading monooxygenase HmoA